MIYLRGERFSKGGVLMRRRYQSSITVFLCMMFLIFLLIIAALFDLSRIIISTSQVQRSLNTTMLSVLANYSDRLKSEYGLLYIDMDDSDIEEEIARVLDFNLSRVIFYDNVLNLYRHRINRDSMEVNENNPLALREQGPLITQILEYSKYLAPLDLAINSHYGQLSYRHLFRNVEQFQELADGFFYSLNVVEFFDEQNEMDRTVNDMLYHHFEFMNNIDGDVFRAHRPDPDAYYVNRPLRDAYYTDSWVSATVLQTYLQNAFDAGTDPADIEDTLELYRQRLVDIQGLIVENQEHFNKLFNENLITEAEQSVADFKVFMEYWSDSTDNPENSSLVDHDFTLVAQSKIGYYELVINSMQASVSEAQSKLNQLNENNNIIGELIDYLVNISDAVSNGDELLALSLASNYDQKFVSDYVEIVVNTSFRNPIKDLYTHMPNLPNFTNYSLDREVILGRIEELVVDEVMHQFFGVTLLGYFDNNVIEDPPPRNIYNPLSRDSFDDVFLDFRYDPGKDWVNDWKVAPNDWISHLIDICIDQGTPAAAIAKEVFAIADFAYAIMHATNDHIHSMDVSGDDLMDQFFINYYAMKTFRSFFTSSTDHFASVISPDFHPPMNPNRHKRNLERRSLHDMPHRDLRYELEYIIFGAEDFYNSNPAGENDSAKYVGLLLYGDRVAKNYAFMRTNPHARYAVNRIASAISSSVPGLENRFTEVLEAVALFWAACESAIDMSILRVGGSVYIYKPYQRSIRAFHLFLHPQPPPPGTPPIGFMANGLKEIMDRPVRLTLTNHQGTPGFPGSLARPFDHNFTGPIYMTGATFNYDAHLMMLLSRVPNDVKISRIQEVINHNMSEGSPNLDYLDNTHAGIDVKVNVTLGMTFLNWDLFRAHGIRPAFDGGFTHEITWFQMY